MITNNSEKNSQLPLLRDKLTEMRVDPLLVTWIMEYLAERPQFVRLKGCMSDTVVSL